MSSNLRKYGTSEHRSLSNFTVDDEGTKTKPGLSEGGTYSSINTGATLGESLKSQFDRSASPTRSRVTRTSVFQFVQV